MAELYDAYGVGKKHQKQLKKLKRHVDDWYRYWKDNIDRYNLLRKFVFKSNLTNDDIANLQALGKPQIEFNELESIINRARGEFAKQEPALTISADYGYQVHPMIINIIESHQRHFIYEGKKNGTEFESWSQLVSGGFSVFETWTDYANPMTFEQDIYYRVSEDPTMYGFDPMAKLPHKGDGRFCFKVRPYTKEEFERLFPKVNTEDLKYVRELNGFSWSYRGQKEEIILVCDMYLKKSREVTLLLLNNGKTVIEDEYKEYLKKIEASGAIIQPIGIKDSRKTILETICRYRFIENQILEYKETNWINLPYVMVIGNSVMLKDTNGGDCYEMTRPLIYHSIGAQKLKNFAGQTYAAWVENMVMHKWKVAKESIPAEYKDAYINPQQAQVLVYNSFKDNNPDVPLNPPMEIQVAPMPPEVAGLFNNMDQTIQQIQGNYDADMSRASQNLVTGVGMEEAQILSNLAQMPYIVGYMVALNQVATIHLDLFAKYVVGERTIPILRPDGQKDMVTINKPGSIEVKYPERSLKVHVEAGVNFGIQKSRALQQIIGLMQASPLFAQFMNVKGLPILLDNLEIRGIDQLKSMADSWQQEMQQQQAQAQQNNPVNIKLQQEQQKIQLQAQKQQLEAALNAAKVGISQMQADTDRIKVMVDAGQARAEHLLQREKHQTENFHSATDLAIKAASEHSKNHRELMGLQHKILEANKPQGANNHA